MFNIIAETKTAYFKTQKWSKTYILSEYMVVRQKVMTNDNMTYIL